MGIILHLELLWELFCIWNYYGNYFAGIDIPPGVMFSIKMEIVNTIYLDKPYGKCTKRYTFQNI